MNPYSRRIVERTIGRVGGDKPNRRAGEATLEVSTFEQWRGRSAASTAENSKGVRSFRDPGEGIVYSGVVSRQQSGESGVRGKPGLETKYAVARSVSASFRPQQVLPQSLATGGGAPRKQTLPPQAQTTTCMLMASKAMAAPNLERSLCILITLT